MICSRCGAQNMDGVTFCGNCGARMNAPSQMQDTPPPLPAGATDPQDNLFGNPPPGSPYAPGSGQHTDNPGQQPAAPPPPVYSAPIGGPSSGGMVMPKDYMLESIIVTVISFLCCCSPASIILGIIAIIKANNVKTEFELGNLNEAIKNSEGAKMLTIWAVVVAVVWYIISLLISMLYIMPLLQNDYDLGNLLNM